MCGGYLARCRQIAAMTRWRFGLHHTRWAVVRLVNVVEGSKQLRTAAYTDGWGVGHHVLDFNYFYDVRDP